MNSKNFLGLTFESECPITINHKGLEIAFSNGVIFRCTPKRMQLEIGQDKHFRLSGFDSSSLANTRLSEQGYHFRANQEGTKVYVGQQQGV